MRVDRLTSITVGLPVDDLDAAVAWYARLLGREPDLEPAPGVVEFCVLPGCWLQLLERPAPPGSGDGSGPEHAPTAPAPGATGPVVRFGVEDLDQVRSRLQERGVDTGPVHTVPGAVRYCEFPDPFGNRLSLYQVIQGD